METGKFDLEKAIAHYVQLINSRGSLTGSDRVELIAHLYDATEALSGTTLTQNEAFVIACSRLGDYEILDKEYSKVNTSVNINKIWAYIFIGFSLLSAGCSLGLLLLRVIEFNLLVSFLSPSASAIVITALHIIICISVVYLVKQKNLIAGFIEKQVERGATTAAAWAFLPLVIYGMLKFIVFRDSVQTILDFPISEIGSSIAQVSFYAVILAVIFGALSLVISANKTGRLSLKTLFEKPGALFLVLTGVLTEFLAASTRMLRFENGLTNGYNIVVSSTAFGLVYLAISIIISFYNKRSNSRYLIVFATFGFIMETSVGINADLGRGTYYTAYFSSALIIAVIAGKFLGQTFGNTVRPAHN